MSRRDMIGLTGLSLAGASLAQCATDGKGALLPLKGQVALVTGAARGIGKAIALRLASLGANIAICDIAEQIPSVKYPLSTAQNLENTFKEVSNSGVQCLSFKVDVRDHDRMSDMAQQIQSKWGRIDMLIANAGIASMSPFFEETQEVWEDIIGVNLGGAANSLRAVLPIMRERKYGRIVCISSQIGRKGSNGASIYCASKWGVIGLSKSIALEEMANNITCNVICPSATDTGMLNNEYVLGKLSPENPTLDGLVEKWSRYVPNIDKEEVAFAMNPQRVADIAQMYCCPEGRHLSGTVFDIANLEAAGNLG